MTSTPFAYTRLEVTPVGRYKIELGQLATDDGPSPYSIVHMRPFACCVASVAGKLALVRQYRYSIDDWQLELPAGGIEAGETPRDAAVRELREETGLAAHDVISLGMYYPSAGSTDEECHIFAARCEDGVRPLKLDRGEQTELVLLSRCEVEALFDEGRLPYMPLYVAWIRLSRSGLLDELFPAEG